MSKKSIIILLVTVAAIVATATVVFLVSGRTENQPDQVYPALTDDEPVDRMLLSNNSVLGHDEREIIGGKFDGKTIDTLRISPAAKTEYVDSSLFVILDGKRFESSGDYTEDWRFLWDIKSDKGTVPTLRTFGLNPLMVFEGDLDGNGTDEFGILFTWLTSACRTYEVFTFHNGQWRWLIPQINTAASLRASGKELVKAGDHPGEIKVTMSDFNAPESCCNYAPDKDTVYTASYENILKCWEKN